jgi:Uma2 family endonuclease
MSTTKLVTAEELMAMGPDARYELIDGELHEMAPSGGEHGGIAWRLVRAIARFEPADDLVEGFIAESGFILARDPDDVVAPDAAYVRIDRLPPRSQRTGPLELAPDIAIEVLSPSDRPGYVQRKVQAYLRAGTQLIWIVDPAAQTLAVHMPGREPMFLKRDDVLDGAPVLPGFRMRISDLFD